ncbi:chromate efflux transporter [Myroides pelagicus]|uniref:Chromate efflux transporter n=1 Tax=Myroides pelagicus TaxID=270914 RepID=A0A7K1GNC9_9FLAO|nr:chromate efflux transporter [Myroides pelagicus]MEC4114243.1 chromate efflux transporter [Myroides pelagicus]MTH30412.1 chromate efflux transporter [Myroides pelagicus]
MKETISLRELAAVFFKLGVIGFGGPAAHIAMMQREVVEKRNWMDQQEFLDLIGITNLIPGPNSTELAIHIGYTARGWKGLLIAGLCFILPAVGITGTLAYFYTLYGKLPQVELFIYGLKPAIIVIIGLLVYKLSVKLFTNIWLTILGISIFFLSLFGLSELTLLITAAAIAATYHFIKKRKSTNLYSLVPFALLTSDSINIKLFFTFLKIGSILYGSGYVLFSFIETELVSKGFLTTNQLIDAITVGQITPGPVFSSVTFVGYQINGWPGAIYSTIAIFLPSFLFVILIKPLVHRLKNSDLFQLILKSVNVAAVALIATTCISLIKESITDGPNLLIALIILGIMLLHKNINTGLVLVISMLLGFGIKLFSAFG